MTHTTSRIIPGDATRLRQEFGQIRQIKVPRVEAAPRGIISWEYACRTNPWRKNGVLIWGILSLYTTIGKALDKMSKMLKSNRPTMARERYQDAQNWQIQHMKWWCTCRGLKPYPLRLHRKKKQSFLILKRQRGNIFGKSQLYGFVHLAPDFLVTPWRHRFDLFRLRRLCSVWKQCKLLWCVKPLSPFIAVNLLLERASTNKHALLLLLLLLQDHAMFSNPLKLLNENRRWNKA